ncbi:MAG: nicotinate (nicotinamide) nucleotide adenylyltransferase [Planctomycetota bacterium]|nr:nicotinate (nicotinamide) nucleotide adenylyltransferase [Planctomycetota bacterium]
MAPPDPLPAPGAVPLPEGRGRPPPAAPRGRRIGLFGGSFDPIHAGHLHAARVARDRFELDRVVFVPAYRSPYKPGRTPAPGPDRMRMVEIAIQGERGFEASDLELARGGASYTIDTVRALPRVLGERPDCALYLVIGSDNLPGLGGWRDVRELLERVQPIVVQRDGDPDALLVELAVQVGVELARKVERGYLRLPPCVASSTDARAALGGDGDGGTVIPAAVLAYIRAHGLYGTRA